MKKIVFALAALAACNADFDPGSRVTELRILAVHADNPYARPGEQVSLDALWFDPAGRTPAFGWATCENPDAMTLGRCFAKADPSSVQIGPASTYSFTMPADVVDSLPATAQEHAVVGVVTIACPGTLAPGSSTYGADTYPFVCAASDGRTLALDEMDLGFRRIGARKTDRNANPAIARVLWDGADWADTEVKDVDACATTGNTYKGCEGPAHAVSVALADGAVESGTSEHGVSFTEQVVVQYFATEGIFEHDLGTASKPETHWAARTAASGTTLTMWMIARDDRGGVAWATRHVKVR